jgi:hypothetical protein
MKQAKLPVREPEAGFVLTVRARDAVCVAYGTSYTFIAKNTKRRLQLPASVVNDLLDTAIRD